MSMYFNIPANSFFLDLETDGLNPTKIHCCIIKHKQTGHIFEFVNNNDASIYHKLHNFIKERLVENSIFIGHNIISFDNEVLDQLCGIKIPIINLVDTLVLSFLYNPKLEGGHSLEIYGERLGFSKIKNEDWTKFTPLMLERCKGDVYLVELVYEALVQRMKKIGFSEQSAELEHKIRQIIDKQTKNGFAFNRDRATDLCRQLRQRQSDLAIPIRDLFPAKLEEVGGYKNRFTKDGRDRALFLKDSQRYDQLIWNTDKTQYQCLERVPFNIGSPKQRVERLLELGWKPENFTKGGQPQADEVALVEFAKKSGRQEAAMMAEWVVLQGRASMVEAWINLVQPDNCIHGKVFTCGARSRRMTHANPNSANIPSEHNGAAYGRECRQLWKAREGRLLVGYDARSLQMRGFCHFVNNPEVTKLYLEGDPHQRNAEEISKKVGFDVHRGGGGAKTEFYAFLFGAQNKKLGAILNSNKSVGAKVRAALYGTTPGLEALVQETIDEFYSNPDHYLRCIDGGYVKAPSEHSALNYRIQPFEAIVMKQANIYISDRANEKGLDWLQVANVHDEGQLDVNPKDVEEMSKICNQSITDAGETFNLNVRLDGETKVAETWAGSH